MTDETQWSHAAAAGQIDVLRTFLDSGYKVDAKNHDGATALHLAISNDRSTTFAMLIKNGASPAVGDIDGDTALHRAVRRGNTETVLALLKTNARDLVHVKNVYGFTPLYLAVRMAQWLPEAIIHGDIKLLLEAGASPLDESYAGVTPVQEAVDTSQYSLVQLLDSYGGSHVVTACPYEEMMVSKELWTGISAIVARALWAREKSLGTIKNYMELVNNIVEYLTANPRPKAGQKGAYLRGQVLYENLVILLCSHVRDLAAACACQPSEQLAPFYLREWDRFQVASKTIDRPFNYLNRHYIRRQRDEGRLCIFEVQELCMAVWKICMLDSNPAFGAVLREELTGQHGEAITSALKKLVIASEHFGDEITAETGLTPFGELRKQSWATSVERWKKTGHTSLVTGVLKLFRNNITDLKLIMTPDAYAALRADMHRILLIQNIPYLQETPVKLSYYSGLLLHDLTMLLLKHANGRELMLDLLSRNGIARQDILTFIPQARDRAFEVIDKGVTPIKHLESWIEEGDSDLEQVAYSKEMQERFAVGFMRAFIKIYPNDKEVRDAAQEAITAVQKHRDEEVQKRNEALVKASGEGEA